MNDRLLPFALRELRTHFAQRTTQVALIGAGLLLGLSGPFDTLALLPTLPRMLYWLTVVVATYGLGSFIGALCSRALVNRAQWQRILAATLAIGLGVGLLLTLLNLAAFGLWLDNPRDALTFFGITTLISGIVVTGAALIETSSSDTPAKQPALLARLPVDKRGPLVSLSVSDHYVEVTTTRGTELLLMRLSDAIAETAPTPGLQIHRSHWAATDQITAVTRTGDRATVTLSTGATLPVSRPNIAALRDAGLLPR